MIEKLKSRKLWIAVATAAFTALASGLGISKEVVDQVVTIAITYIIGQATVDTVEKAKQSPIRKDGTANLLVMALGASICCMSLISCSGVQVDLENKPSDTAIRGSITQVAVKQGEDGKAKAVVDYRTILGWFSKAARIASGEDVKKVILEPASGEATK